MNFKEAFERYKLNTATSEEIEFVEEELEKNRLIMEFLNEQDDLDIEWKDDLLQEKQSEIKKIRKSINRKGMLIVTISVSIILCLLLVFNFLITPLLNQAFYNPLRKSYSSTSVDFDAGMSAYTELHYPGSFNAASVIHHTGIGKYDISVFRYDLLRGDQKIFQMQLNRGKLKLPYEFFDTDLFKEFLTTGTESNKSGSGSPAEMKNYLKEMPNYIKVKAMITFNQPMSMNEVSEMVNKNESIIWVGVRMAEDETLEFPTIGFSMYHSGIPFDNINSKYPYFDMYQEDSNSEKKQLSGDILEAHFKALLRFMMDQKDFVNAIGNEGLRTHYYASIYDYVSQNGASANGVMMIGSPSEILKYCEEQPVDKIGIKVWFNN